MYILDESSVNTLRELVRWWRMQADQLRRREEAELYQGVRVRIARTPSTGIDPMVNLEPGSAECKLYDLLRPGIRAASLVWAGINEEVFNLSTVAIAGGSYIVVVQEPGGAWMAIGGALGLEFTECPVNTGTAV